MTATKAEVAPPPEMYDLDCETLIVGAGAAGLVAALAAHEAGQSVLVVEADPVPRGSTALSAGLIPAAGTRAQAKAGIADNAARFAADIQVKAANQNEQSLVDRLAANSASVIDWLTETHGLPFSVITNFDYPGHSRRRMHGLPTRSGSELIDTLRATCEARETDIICQRRAARLFFRDERMDGIEVIGPDGGTETIGCRKLILACNGFGGNRALVTKYLPEIDNGLWFGHDGNRGEAILWGGEIGADLVHLGSYQGHGNVAHPHGVLITWAVITEGGVQVNRDGVRFWNEAQGYSEAARAVLSQPGGEAFAVFDSRIADVARQFEDFKQAESAGAIRTSATLEGLALELGLPVDAFARTIRSLPRGGSDAFGRTFGTGRLEAPYCGVRVTGALFHTQGGLRTGDQARVMRADGTAFSNLYACGGAACGVSGTSDRGYLSGNGLLSAVVLGRLAGAAPLV